MCKGTAIQATGSGARPRSEFTVAVERSEATPIHLQICARFKTAIVAGNLRPGERVPSVRSLASELGLARGTVTLAYQILAEEGYLTFRGSAGTFVDASRSARREGSPQPSVLLKRQAGAATEGIRPLQLGLPALDAFPRKVWNRLVGRHSRALTPEQLAYPDPAGHRPLRERIAAYLGFSRGIVCAPEQIFVTGGHRASLGLIFGALAAPDDQCWFEDPGYVAARDFLTSSGVRLRPVPVDRDGLSVDQGKSLAPAARFALVTPANQSPLGVMMSRDRRLQLLDWAAEGRRWIVEDDYDSEYRYDRRPPRPLKSLDADDRVLYAGTFSKVLYPGLRLSYLVIPASEVERFARHSRLIHSGCPTLHQAVVAEFMGEGHFARHLKKMRSLYAHRHRMLVEALDAVFGDALEIASPATGLHLVAGLPGFRASDRAIANSAREKGLGVEPLSAWYIGRNVDSALLLGFTNIGNANTALRVSESLYEACSAATD